LNLCTQRQQLLNHHSRRGLSHVIRLGLKGQSPDGEGLPLQRTVISILFFIARFRGVKIQDLMDHDALLKFVDFFHGLDQF